MGYLLDLLSDAKKVISEGRVESDYVKYKTLNKSGKETEDKDRITKVIAVLSHQKGSAATKLIDSYETIQSEKKKLDEQLDSMKADMLDYVQNMFDETDRAYTNILETASMTITMSKESERNTVKWEKFLEKLKVLLPEMVKTFDDMVAEVTTTTKVASSLKAKFKGDDDMNESVLSTIKDKLKTLLNSFLDKFKRKNDKFESDIKELKKLM
jgi:hypothetical protein